MKSPWLKFQKWLPWFVAALVVLSSNWAAVALLDTFDLWATGETGEISLRRAGYFAIFMIAVYWLYRQRGAFFRPYTRRLSNEPVEQRKHLVLFLSSLPSNLEKYGGVPEAFTLSNDIDRDISEIEVHKQGNPLLRWSWEMPLRAIRAHLGALQTATLICSRESLPQAHLFLDICRKYDRLQNITFHVLVSQDGMAQLVNASFPWLISSFRGWDFESFDELSDALFNSKQNIL